jgi:hypothetical protein
VKPDLINGLFEGVGAALLWLNVRQLLRDKQVKGVHWGPVVFYVLWGCWNLVYYPALQQRASFVGGIGVMLANAVWLCLLLRYRNSNAAQGGQQ